MGATLTFMPFLNFFSLSLSPPRHSGSNGDSNSQRGDNHPTSVTAHTSVTVPPYLRRSQSHSPRLLALVTLSLCLFLLCLSLPLTSMPVHGDDPTPNTPPDGSNAVSPTCLLERLSLSGGLRLRGGFKSNLFHYMCECLAGDPNLCQWDQIVVYPTPYDFTSLAELTFNQWKEHWKTNDTAISEHGWLKDAGAPFAHSKPLKLNKGLNHLKIGVGWNKKLTDNCYYQYEILCQRPDSSDGDDAGCVVGDPQFLGLRGQSYQVHGVPGEIYSIVSTPAMQYNARFVFLDGGECPVIDGQPLTGCWSHPGTYLGELGLKTNHGDRIRIRSGSAQEGLKLVEVNGRPVDIEESVELAAGMGMVTLDSTHLVTVSIGSWQFAFENSDHFVNQRVRIRLSEAAEERAHGLLGQTWREVTYKNAIKYVEGSVDDYVVKDGDLFGDKFSFNQFQPKLDM